MEDYHWELVRQKDLRWLVVDLSRFTHRICGFRFIIPALTSDSTFGLLLILALNPPAERKRGQIKSRGLFNSLTRGAAGPGVM